MTDATTALDHPTDRTDGVDRQRLRIDGALDDARAAVEAFVAELQAGLDQHDAVLYNRHFADDVLWGSPFGAFVEGYADLHPIHRDMQARAVGAGSQYEIVRVLAPAVGVALGFVRRIAAPSTVEAGFDEVALYVLIRRDGEWWLAAGQNTPIRGQGVVAAGVRPSVAITCG